MIQNNSSREKSLSDIEQSIQPLAANRSSLSTDGALFVSLMRRSPLSGYSR